MRILLLSVVFLASLSHAREGGGINTVPVPQLFSYPSGLVFPGLNGAAAINAAALPASGRATAVQAAFTPSLQSGDPMGIFGGIAMARKGLGLGLGIEHTSVSNLSTLGGFAGAGFAWDALSLGVGLRDSDLDGGFSPQVDVGLLVGEGKDRRGVAFGAVFYNLNTTAVLGAGIGYRGGKKYHLEANVVLPPFSDMDGNYTITAAATINAGIFGLFFRTSYFTQPSDFSHTVGALAWISQRFNLIAQFTTNRTATVGATVLF